MAQSHVSCCSDASPWTGPRGECPREHAHYARSRKNSGEGQPLDSLPLSLSRNPYECSWEIDVRKLEKAPAFRDAMLLLRSILGGPSWLN